MSELETHSTGQASNRVSFPNDNRNSAAPTANRSRVCRGDSLGSVRSRIDPKRCRSTVLPSITGYQSFPVA